MEKNRPNGLMVELGTQPVGNPWQGFAHPSHRAEELEPLRRTLRFALIQLNKFWVEVNAFPVFMNELKGASLKQIERLFDWFQAAPSWSARVTQPRLVPELVQEASRKALLDFTSRVVRARSLRAKLEQMLSAKWSTEAEMAAAIARLEEASKLAHSQGLESGGVGETEARIRELSVRLERNSRLQAYFARLSAECGLGMEATSLSTAQRVFQAAEIARQAPLSVWQWRKLPVMSAQNRARILAWQERSLPLLEARRRVEPLFRTSERVASAQLRLLAEKIGGSGMFRALSSDYKDAVRRYQELLRLDPHQKAPKETPAKMAEQLDDWAGYLERKAQVDDGAEAKALFGRHFKGIDTDFAGALEANAWATATRAELESEDKGLEADFCSRLADALFEVSQDKLVQAAELCSGPGRQAIQVILAQPDYASGREFAAIACDDEARWMEVTRLRDHLAALGVKPQTRLTDLEALATGVSELRELLKGIEAMAEPRLAFKQAYAGESTDLGLLASAQDYIDFVHEAGLSEGLRASFLSSHGPQRLQDTRKLVAPALAGMAHVKEHFKRLEVATHGQSKDLDNLPLLDLINRIQHALKHPELLAEQVREASSPGGSGAGRGARMLQ
jgi:hypothetical protein